MKEAQKKTETSTGDGSISALGAFFVYLITGLFLGVGFLVARNLFSVDLVSDLSLTLFLLWSIEFPVVVITYSLLRKTPEKCSCSRAVGRSILGLVSGAFVNALGAIALGATIEMQLRIRLLIGDCDHPLCLLTLALPLISCRHLPKTIHWSFLMSVFTFVPAIAVFGASWTDGHRAFISMKPSGNTEYMIVIPAYGAIVGGWFGAWPMPLDWERPWQNEFCFDLIASLIERQQ
ncbi:hypothetical protein Bca101_053020 [Brassica carinata]